MNIRAISAGWIRQRARQQRFLCRVSGGYGETGFSLVEIMVALMIGMFGIIVMMQVFGLFESQKRTTTGGDDAISSGSIALYGIQRMVQQSGWGISSPSVIGCTVNPSPAFATAAVVALPLVPVTINSGLITVTVDDNTDTLLVVAGTSPGSVEGDEISSTTVKTPAAFTAGDRVVSAPFSGTCQAATATRKLGVFSAPDQADVDTGGKRVFNLGQVPVVRGYAIRSGNLTECDFVAADCSTEANWRTVANNIVSLRAVYGRDTSYSAVATSVVASGSMDGTVDVWDQSVPTPTSPNLLKNSLACAWARVSAVHIALVARSSQAERRQQQGRLDGQMVSAPAVTQSAPTWQFSGSFAIDLTATSPDATWPTWQDFRYKVFETAVPLRNITSQGVMPEC